MGTREVWRTSSGRPQVRARGGQLGSSIESCLTHAYPFIAIEETVFASCSVDKSIRIWDTRERSKSMITVPDAHSCDVNVISWNRLVAYMLCSGADDGQVGMGT